MTWRDNLRPASFRGVPFFVDTEEGNGGRRTVTHEFPLLDDPFVEDMGRKTRTFTLDAYVIGQDYHTAKNALIKALEGSGPGAMVLPYTGERKVAIDGYRYRESVDEGGMCRFSIDCIETPAQPLQPSATTVSSIGATNAAAALLSALSTSFVSIFDVGDAPQFALDSLTEIMGDATAAVDAAFSPIITAVQDLAVFKRQVEDLVADAEALIRAPEDLVLDVLAILGPIESAGAREFVRALIGVAQFETDAAAPGTLTPTRTQEGVNQVALMTLWRVAAIAQASVSILSVDFASYDDAITVRDELLDLIDVQSETAADEVFEALLNLRATVVNAVPGQANELARLVEFTPVTTVPSVVFAYGIYGDLVDELDIVARNRVKHPGFIPGGIALQVLSRA